MCTRRGIALIRVVLGVRKFIDLPKNLGSSVHSASNIPTKKFLNPRKPCAAHLKQHIARRAQICAPSTNCSHTCIDAGSVALNARRGTRRDVAGSLLVTEVFTPAGHWSSYPSHRHDEDDFPRMTYLEETYYHRLNPGQGFGIQRVYTEDGSLDETMAVKSHDVVLVPRGHHPCGAPYGYDMYYLNVMAGPRRNWRFQNDPDHDWIAQRDA